MTPPLQATIAHFAGEVLNAMLWTGAAVGVLGAFILVIGLCRRAGIEDGKVAADLEIDR